MKYPWIRSKPWVPVYEDGDPPPVNPPVDPPVPPPTPPTPPSKEDEVIKFNQIQVNKMMAEEKRKAQKQVEATVAQLEQVKQSKTLSDKERGELQARIEEINNSLLTKEQLAAKERERLQGEHKKTTEQLATERDAWKSKYTDSTITRAILDEALEAEAYKPQQIVTLLKGNTRLVEVLDAESNPTGEFQAKVKMSDTDKDGKPQTLDLTVAEALKLMKGKAEDYGNLFKSGVAGGLGSGTNPGGKKLKPEDMTPEQYREARKNRGW